MADYISCVEASGANQQRVETEVSNAQARALSAGAQGSGSGVIAKGSGSLVVDGSAERALAKKFEKTWFSDAMVECRKVLVPEKSGNTGKSTVRPGPGANNSPGPVKSQEPLKQDGKPQPEPSAVQPPKPEIVCRIEVEDVTADFEQLAERPGQTRELQSVLRNPNSQIGMLAELRSYARQYLAGRSAASSADVEKAISARLESQDVPGLPVHVVLRNECGPNCRTGFRVQGGVWADGSFSDNEVHAFNNDPCVIGFDFQNSLMDKMNVDRNRVEYGPEVPPQTTVNSAPNGIANSGIIVGNPTVNATPSRVLGDERASKLKAALADVHGTIFVFPDGTDLDVIPLTTQLCGLFPGRVNCPGIDGSSGSISRDLPKGLVGLHVFLAGPEVRKAFQDSGLTCVYEGGPFSSNGATLYGLTILVGNGEK
jgi:hypothetical protein